MQKMTFYKNLTNTTLNCIIEPLKDTDEVYVVSNGKVYKWDNTVTETTTEYLEHFSEVSVNDCPVFNNCSDSNISFTDIVEKEVAKNKIKYESTNENHKTESFLLNYFSVKNRNIFPNNWEKVTMADNLADIAEWIIKVNKRVAMQLIPDDYKDLSDDTQLTQVLASALTLSLRDDKANREIAIIKAVKACCDNLKAAKESKIQSDKENKKPTDKEEKKQAVEEKKKSDES